jgi:hypothetical protein
MKNIINTIKSFILNSKFELGHIGDLSLYTCNELSIHLKKFDKRVLFEGSNMIVTWESKRTILVIKYDLDQNFIKKLDEKWSN